MSVSVFSSVFVLFCYYLLLLLNFRLDCPKEWGELIPTLLTAVKSDNKIVQHRALLTLYHVVKALSSKRLAGDRRLFQELTANVFNFILNLWDNYTCLAVRQVRNVVNL